MIAGMDWTTVVAVDARTIHQFRQVWPTWNRYKPEIAARPFLVICDTKEIPAVGWPSLLPNGIPQQTMLLWWSWRPDLSQRERMLTAFVKLAPVHCKTTYWLKVDVDSVATGPEPWIDPAWFIGSPALIAAPWGYTKPANYITAMQDWWPTIPKLQNCTGPDWPTVEPGNEVYRWARIISRQCFLHTTWCREAAAYCPDRLPVPSQDTYHWFLAEFQRKPIIRTRQIKCGWTNRNTQRGLREAVAGVMQEGQVA